MYYVLLDEVQLLREFGSILNRLIRMKNVDVYVTGSNARFYGCISLVLAFSTSDQKIAFLKSLFEETYISDIVGRHNIRNKAELEELLNILSSTIGSLSNPEKLSATFRTVKKKKISNSTIKRYIDYLCDSFLIDSAIRYDVKGKKYIDTPAPYYNESGVLIMSVYDFLLNENSLEN